MLKKVMNQIIINLMISIRQIIQEGLGTLILALAIRSDSFATIPLALLLSIFLFNKSPCQFNLSITIAASITYFRLQDIFNILAQILGAFLGNILSYLLFGKWASVIVNST